MENLMRRGSLTGLNTLMPLVGKSNGSGYSYNNGNSNGSGYGYGYGYGYSNSYGNGSGYGYGDSYGYSNSYGYGDSYGNGDSDNTVQLWQSLCADDLSRSEAVTLALWNSDSQGGPTNGGTGRFVATPGLIQEVTGPLLLCSRNALHATLDPSAWKGERVWIVALHGSVEGDHNKLGALKREILREIPLRTDGRRHAT